MSKSFDTESGEEALTEVAKPDGAWNWCVLGPDPSSLPLVAGGFGSVEEIQAAIGSHPTVFALIRMSFGSGPKMTHHWMTLLASDKAENAAKNVSPVAEGKAAQKAPQMEAAIKKFSPDSVSLTTRNKDDCTAQHLIEALAKAVSPNTGIGVPEYAGAIEELTKASGRGGAEADQVAALAVAEQLAGGRRPSCPVVEPGCAVPVEGDTSKAQEKIEVPKVGDVVQVWSWTSMSWHDDGVVVKHTEAGLEEDGVKIPPGSINVLFNNRKWIKWLLPTQVGNTVKKSDRPKPPQDSAGELKKETHNMITTWNVRYCVLRDGLLQWWMNEKDYKDDKDPNGTLALVDAQIKWSKKNFTTFSVSTATSNGVKYKFSAATDEIGSRWAEQLQKQAAYCKEYSKYLAEKKKKEKKEGGEDPVAQKDSDMSVA